MEDFEGRLGISDELIAEMTQTMGRLHTALHTIDLRSFDLRGKKLDEINSEELELEANTVMQIARHLLEDEPLVREAFDLWHQWKEEINLEKVTRGIIHTDIGPGANILKKDGRVTAVVDMLEIKMGYFMMDVDNFLGYFHLHQQPDEEKLDRFKRNYFPHAPISENEFEALPFFRLYKVLSTLFYWYWKPTTGNRQGLRDDEDARDIYRNAIDHFKTFWIPYFGIKS